MYLGQRGAEPRPAAAATRLPGTVEGSLVSGVNLRDAGNLRPWRFAGRCPVVTLIIGSLGTLLLDERRDRRALDRAEAERIAAREETIAERREAFELTHLLEVHATLRGVRHSVHTVFAHVDPTNHPFYGAVAEAHRLNGLVLDDRVRGQVEVAIQIAAKLAKAAPSPEPMKALEDLSPILNSLDDAADALSERIRIIYKGSVTSQ
jgi:hypothetical protein